MLSGQPRMSAQSGCHGRPSDVQAAAQCKASPLAGHTWTSLAPALRWGRHSEVLPGGSTPGGLGDAQTAVLRFMSGLLEPPAYLPRVAGQFPRQASPLTGCTLCQSAQSAGSGETLVRQ